jgi:predicted nucleic acid-binding protein
MLYLDTSIVVSLLSVETRTSDVLLWLKAQGAADFAVSDWVVTEFWSALSMKIRSGAIDTAQRALILAQFAQLLSDKFRVLRVDEAAFRTAARFSDQAQLNLRSGDALHLAVCAEHGATICTLDQAQSRAAPVLGVASLLL